MAATDLTTQVFHYLTVISASTTKFRRKHKYWLCQCKCGKEVHATTGALRSGHTKSCGCYCVEERIKRCQKLKDAALPSTTVEYKLLYKARECSRYSKISCDLILSDIVIPEKCPVLHIPLIKVRDPNILNGVVLIRVDIEKGYTKGNCIIISRKALLLSKKGDFLVRNHLLKITRQSKPAHLFPYDNASVAKDLLKTSKARAKKLNLLHDLLLADIKVPEYCPVFPWIKLEKGKDVVHDASPTLDRIIPSLGYTKTNVQVISMRANRLKRDCLLVDLEHLVTYLRSHTK